MLSALLISCGPKHETGYRDGLYRVGVNIEPGVYHTKVGKNAVCKWSLTNDETTVTDMLTVDQEFEINVLQGDKFVEFTGSCEWIKVGP